MTWYPFYDRATELIDERRREADQHRLSLAGAMKDGHHPESGSGGPAATGWVRRPAAHLAAALGRSSLRLARALDPRLDRRQRAVHAGSADRRSGTVHA